MLAYLTDVEGQWDKLAAFADGAAGVTLAADGLVLADGVTFVFGGDAVDRGPNSQRIVATLLAARARYGERVVLLAGNRDINKLRLAHELTGSPPPGAPAGAPRGELLRWIFEHTMGAPRAFEHRRTELGGAPVDDDAVVDSFIADVAPGGPMQRYLAACQLGHRDGATLFLHGGVTADNLGVVPGATARAASVDAWLAALARFYRDELAAFDAGRSPAALIAYQAALPGTHENQTSVVYARPTDEVGTPHLPARSVIAALAADGIDRVVVGHTPSGDCPAIVRTDDFELVLADNSYGRLELGAHLVLTADATRVRAMTVLDDGSHCAVACELAPGDRSSPIGRRLRDSGQLIKSRLADGRLLLFRGLPGRKVEQLAIAPDALAGRTLEAAFG